MMTILASSAAVIAFIVVIYLCHKLDQVRAKLDLAESKNTRLETMNGALERENATLTKTMNAMLDAANARKLWREDAGAQGLHRKTPAVTNTPQDSSPNRT